MEALVDTKIKPVHDAVEQQKSEIKEIREILADYGKRFALLDDTICKDHVPIEKYVPSFDKDPDPTLLQ
eukprot:3840031-Karenia_brevis.AAC.1